MICPKCNRGADRLYGSHPDVPLDVDRCISCWVEAGRILDKVKRAVRQIEDDEKRTQQLTRGKLKLIKACWGE